MSEECDDDPVAVLRLRYDQAVQERDRIRAARAFFARQLGPLPTFAGVSVSLVAAFSEKIQHREWLWVALGGFVVMAVVSMLYSRMPAYRQIRASRVPKRPEEDARGVAQLANFDTPRAWYEAELALECQLYGPPRKNNEWGLPWRRPQDDLQCQLDRERTGVFVTQSLFIVVIVALVLAHLPR
jgi:hypothetical protein